MADDLFYEVIPWQFCNTKIVEDADLLVKVKELNHNTRRRRRVSS